MGEASACGFDRAVARFVALVALAIIVVAIAVAFHAFQLSQEGAEERMYASMAWEIYDRFSVDYGKVIVLVDDLNVTVVCYSRILNHWAIYVNGELAAMSYKDCIKVHKPELIKLAYLEVIKGKYFSPRSHGAVACQPYH